MTLAKAPCQSRPTGRLLSAGLLLSLAVNAVWAQSAPTTANPAATATTAPITLSQAFEAAWLRQPEALSRQARQDAAQARRQTADSWTAEPVSVELSTKTDHLHTNPDGREDAAGLSFPLWLPGERARSAAVAQADERVNASRVLAAQLRTASTVRETYWQWQRAVGEHALALERLVNTQQLAADVAKRVKAGDLARADQHQADGAAAAADGALAEALGVLAAAAAQLRALTGAPPARPGSANIDEVSLGEQLAATNPDPAALSSRHPALLEWQDRLELARRASELARVQTRANPELTLAAARGRGQADERYQQSFTLALRIPFGS
ncbi:TolC family protein, partial [Rhodoferax sp.]|uniref:TolC family protein n=1 Tax=Rhodoferax sp. TaxID=50421 RepID=UPI0027512DF6|nr:TolC family protein [Rhodoferax sp.]